ncbi:MAG: hypothetical protein WAS25_01875 [Geothrix sp.]|uniref:YncE family protein n=1 Tax=Geothrix sp. TaxID=1962974 RepID=UPI003BAEAF64
MAAALSILICACGGGGGGNSSPSQGTAPTLSNLHLSPDAAVVGDGGGSIYATLSMSFSDPDGDITTIRISSGGQSQDSTLSGTTGLKSGSVQGTLALNTTTVGNFSFQVALLDAKGHLSNLMTTTFAVTPQPAPPPTISFLNPRAVVTAGPSFTMTVTGSGFFPDSQIFWNGSPRTTTYLAPDTLKAEISAPDIATAGTVQVKVVNPTSEGGSSSQVPITIGSLSTLIVPEVANDVAWDAAHGLLYASIPSTSAKYGNRVVAVNPATGAITASVFAGSEPNRLAVSGDGQFLYVGLDGSSSIQRFALPALTLDLSIPLPMDGYFGPYYTLDLQVAPLSPRTVAVSLANKGVSPSAQGGIVIFDDATPRPVRANGWSGGGNLYTSLQWGLDDKVLYAANNQTTGYNYYILAVDAAGVTLTKDLMWTFSSFQNAIHFEPTTNRIYAGSGQVLTPSSGQLVGSFAAQGSMIPVASLASAFYLTWDPLLSYSYKLQRFHLTEFTLKDTLTLPLPSGVYYPPSRLVGWSGPGLASCGNGHPLSIHSGPFVAGTTGGATVQKTSVIPATPNHPSQASAPPVAGRFILEDFRIQE